MTDSDLFQGIRACIFDFDGTLVDSMGVWDAVDRRFFETRGLQIPEDYQLAIQHLGFHQTAIYTKNLLRLDDSLESIENEWMSTARQAYETEIVAKPHVRELLQQLKDAGIHLAIATSNTRPLFEPCLKHNNLEDYFELVLTSSEVPVNKNTPEIYQMIAEHFHVRAEETLVFEDILKAIETVKSASFRAVGVYDEKSKSNKEQIQSIADRYIYDYAELL